MMLCRYESSIMNALIGVLLNCYDMTSIGSAKHHLTYIWNQKCQKIIGSVPVFHVLGEV